MNRPTSFHIRAGVSLLLAVTVAGCGAGSERLGFDSSVEVRLVSDNIADLDLVVAPEEGPVTDPNACTETGGGSLNCSREFLNNRTTLFKFTTKAAASSKPYYVYVINLGANRHTYRLEVSMDNSLKVDRSLSIDPGFAARVARIHRNNAD
jgi:hypothetical protein